MGDAGGKGLFWRFSVDHQDDTVTGIAVNLLPGDGTVYSLLHSSNTSIAFSTLWSKSDRAKEVLIFPSSLT